MNDTIPSQNVGSTGVLDQSPSFLSQVFFFFGLAILTSALGVWVGFQYFIQLFVNIAGAMWILFAVELLLVFTSRYWSRLKPLNYGLFALFSFITGLTIVPLLANIMVEFGASGFGLISKALLATTLMFSATAIFGWVTRRNLMGMGGFLFAALIGMIIVGIIGIFIPWGNNMEMIYAGIGVILFGAFTMFDIQRIKNSHFDNPLDAALELYLDIFNLFIYILRIMRAFSRD